MDTESRTTEQTRSERDNGDSDRERTDTTNNRLLRGLLVALASALVVRGLRRRSLGGAALVLVGGWLLSRTLGGFGRRDRTTVSRSITVGKPADECYDTWRDPDQLSRVMGHFAEITAADDDGIRWTVDGPGEREFSWETRIVEDVPGEYVRWETPPNAVLAGEGSVRFQQAPGDRGTRVTLSMRIDPPGGAVGNAVLTRLDAAPAALAGRALRRFKRLAESGEIPTLEGNPSGRGTGDLV